MVRSQRRPSYEWLPYKHGFTNGDFTLEVKDGAHTLYLGSPKDPDAYVRVRDDMIDVLKQGKNADLHYRGDISKLEQEAQGRHVVASMPPQHRTLLTLLVGAVKEHNLAKSDWDHCT